MPATTYPFGQTVRFIGTFWASANPSGAAINPASAYLTFRDPRGSVASYGFGSASVAGSPGLVRMATGAYLLDFSPSVFGEWRGQWHGDVEGNGAFIARDPFTFRVADVV